MRPVEIVTDYLMTAEGSALIKVGNTHVLCAATVEDTVPQFLRNSGKGWVTAEYSMLPRATAKRTPREVTKGRPSGRTHEIQRLIGRSLRSVVDMAALGERTVMIDCDVLQADGGTRTASITGAFVALALALRQLVRYGALKAMPLRDYVAATSVGLVGGVPMLDLCYEEDSQADVDMNVVMTGAGRFVEVQATAEHTPFDDEQMGRLIALARGGIAGADRDSEEGRADLIRLYCATGNPGKLREFRLAAGHAPVEIELLPGFREHSAVRGGRRHVRRERHPSRRGTTGRHAPGLLFADDSGLEVDALGGAPGVYSARFSGPHATDAANNRLLLEKLRGVANRAARFVCAIALVEGERVCGVYRGAVEGVILDEPRGSGGFGYDPLFYYPPFGCTFGEAADERKFSVSHRGQALLAMLRELGPR